jgi:cyclopropane-fatty-acyl-phospholipid synthase
MNSSKAPVAIRHSRKSFELSRNILLRALDGLQGGSVVLSQPGYPNANLGELGHSAPIEIQVLDHRVFGRILRGGSLAAGETYIDGLWRCSDLHALLLLMAKNKDRLDQIDSKVSRITTALQRLARLFIANNKRRAKRNILAHYDIGNDFYQSFLDPKMQYSSAIYPTPDTTLEQAQQHKLTRIGQQLELKPSDHLLEIGTGWGGLAIEIAEQFGCRVTTTTISDKQYQYAVEAVEKRGLSNRVNVLNHDYRDLQGEYDKLVSIEMIEAVGERYLPLFAKRCAQHLKAGGTMLIQAITIDENRFNSYRNNIDFIQQFVFPGGFLPSVPLLEQLFSKAQLEIVDRLPMAQDYARTLRDWHLRVLKARRDGGHNFGFDDAFYRLWHFYFAYCEAGFRTANTDTWQFTLTKTD